MIMMQRARQADGRSVRVEVLQARRLVWPGPLGTQDRCGPVGAPVGEAGGLRVRVRVLDKQATTATAAVPLAVRRRAACPHAGCAAAPGPSHILFPSRLRSFSPEPVTRLPDPAPFPPRQDPIRIDSGLLYSIPTLNMSMTVHPCTEMGAPCKLGVGPEHCPRRLLPVHRVHSPPSVLQAPSRIRDKEEPRIRPT